MFQTAFDACAKLNALVAIAFCGAVYQRCLFATSTRRFLSLIRVLDLVQSGLSIVTFYEKQTGSSCYAQLRLSMPPSSSRRCRLRYQTTFIFDQDFKFIATERSPCRQKRRFTQKQRMGSIWVNCSVTHCVKEIAEPTLAMSGKRILKSAQLAKYRISPRQGMALVSGNRGLSG